MYSIICLCVVLNNCAQHYPIYTYVFILFVAFSILRLEVFFLFCWHAIKIIAVQYTVTILYNKKVKKTI